MSAGNQAVGTEKPWRQLFEVMNEKDKISVRIDHEAFPDTVIFIGPDEDPDLARRAFVNKHNLDKPFTSVNFPSGWRKGKSPGRPKKFSKDDETEEFFEE